MNTDTLTSSEIIDLMIDLRIQFAELENKINALKPAFFDACSEYDTLRFTHERAIIFRKLTPGIWNYPDSILEQEKQIRQLKQEFQQTHDPLMGRDITWAIKLLAD
jgi:hypothetical protein